MNLRHFLVKKIYGDHNSSKAVRDNLAYVTDALSDHGIGLNIGAGNTRFSKSILNMEIDQADGIDVVGSVESIPFDDGYFDIIICQEVIEHVEDPFKAITEIHRVLKPGAICYIQLPFTIGYHGCPSDYWRFTKDGIVRLMQSAGLTVMRTGASVGPATGFYRICVEFMAILLSLPLNASYIVWKGLFSILLYPIKWLDRLMALSPNAHRIDGGYYVVARK